MHYSVDVGNEKLSLSSRLLEKYNIQSRREIIRARCRLKAVISNIYTTLLLSDSFSLIKSRYLRIYENGRIFYVSFKKILF